MERTGKSSVIREMRKFLKQKEKDLFEIDQETIATLDKQALFLQENTNGFVLKENGLMSTFYNETKEFRGVEFILAQHSEIIRKEKDLNHANGVVHFFLIPQDMRAANNMFKPIETPSYYSDLMSFYKNINLTSLTQGLDVRLMFFSEFDRIFDVRDKILKIIENEYEI